MDTYLAPIEKPAGPLTKLLYFVSRRMFGKVLTPLKVVYARLPPSFTWFSFKIGKLDKQLKLPAETRMLVRERVARINVCLFCINIGLNIHSDMLCDITKRKQAVTAGGATG
jgi:alkylhydroperoxidase family enzyme